METINQFAQATGWLHSAVTAYAGYGIALFGLLLLAGWWTARRSNNPRLMTAAISAGAATLLALALNQPIVHAAARPRPYTTHPGLLVLAHRSSDPSFPSDHATMAGAVAAGLLLVSVRLGIVAAGAALLMAADRVYVGAHYPIDVLAGLVVGATVATVGSLIASHQVERVVTRASSTRLRPLLTGAPAFDL